MEFVYVVPREVLFPHGAPQGFVPFGPALDRQGLLERIEASGFFVERARAEQEPRWKQIIPYALITQAERVWLLERTARGGDARLHGKLSIGVGGHLEPIDAQGPQGRAGIPAAGAARELSEELEFEPAGAPEELGLLNDDSNPVGSVHVGLVLRLEALGPVAVREREVLKGRWIERQELAALAESGANLESWSRLLVPLVGRLEPSPERRAAARP
jgi:predicted NUDIX family phosphoesterase